MMPLSPALILHFILFIPFTLQMLLNADMLLFWLKSHSFNLNSSKNSSCLLFTLMYVYCTRFTFDGLARNLKDGLIFFA
jgi:hypothetical protein